MKLGRQNPQMSTTFDKIHMPTSKGSIFLFLVGKTFSISGMHWLVFRKFKNKMPILQKRKLYFVFCYITKVGM